MTKPEVDKENKTQRHKTKGEKHVISSNQIQCVGITQLVKSSRRKLFSM